MERENLVQRVEVLQKARSSQDRTAASHFICNFRLPLKFCLGSTYYVHVWSVTNAGHLKYITLIQRTACALRITRSSTVPSSTQVNTVRREQQRIPSENPIRDASVRSSLGNRSQSVSLAGTAGWSTVQTVP